MNPQQPPRLRARLRITSDLGRPLHETYRDSPSLPRNSNSALPIDRPRMHINPDINSIFNSRTEDVNHCVNIVHGSDSAFMRATRPSSVEVQPTAGNIAATAVQHHPSLVEPPGMTDNIIQHFIAGHNMANEMRAQHGQQIRNDRAGGTRTPSQVPTAFQQMTALSLGRLMEPPTQAPVHNLDPLGLFQILVCLQDQSWSHNRLKSQQAQPNRLKFLLVDLLSKRRQFLIRVEHGHPLLMKSL